MAERSGDWMRQAEKDLQHARNSLKDADYEWACFAAQQAAEKGVKAILQKLGAEAWGHSVNDLLKGANEKVDLPDELVESAKRLDKFYIPARYPNGWSAGFPGEYITKEDAENAINDSEKILRFCKNILAE